MYLSIGKTTVIREDEIIGIFDLDNCSQSYLSREFLSTAEKAGKVRNAAEDLPHSFLICNEQKENEQADRIYLSQSTSRTLEKRLYQLHEVQTERRNTWRKTMN